MREQNAPFRKYRTIFCLIVIATLVCAAHPAQAQSRFQGGLNLLLGFPQGEFADEVDETGGGIAGEFVYSPPAIPLGFGASLGFMNYGRESRREPFSSTIPDVEVDVITSNNIFLGHLLLRVQSNKGAFRPYLDGLLGFSYLFTDTKIENISDPGDGELASSQNLDDGVFSYGGGGGIMIEVYRSKSGDQGRMWSLSIDLRGRYLIGGEAEYLKKGSVGRHNGQVSYDIIKSKTDLLTAQVGVAVDF
jgi:hypothetical protein